jgi:hypothetical protein
MGNSLLFSAVKKRGKDNLESTVSSLWETSARDIGGTEQSLGDMGSEKKVVMIVNVATK